MKRYLRSSMIVLAACAVTGIVLHSGTRSHAIADATVRVPIPPLVLIADSLRTITVNLDEKIAELRQQEIALRSRMSMPVLSASLLEDARPLVRENGMERPGTRSDAFELTSYISRQQQFISKMGEVIEQRRDLLNALPMLTPCQGSNTSDFGMRVHPISGTEKMHTGIDIAAPHGRPIRAAGDGIVAFSGTRNGYGNTVEVDHGYGYRTLYGHASRLNVKEGDTVRRGQVIAFVGATGAATGPHLHYEVMVDDTKVNPTAFLIETPVMDAPSAAAKPAVARAAKACKESHRDGRKSAGLKKSSRKASASKGIASKKSTGSKKTSGKIPARKRR